MAAPYDLTDLVYKTSTTNAFAGEELTITPYVIMDSPINIKTLAVIDEYRVSGNAWKKRKHGGAKDIDAFSIEFVYEPAASVDLDDIFFAEGAKLGTTLYLKIWWGDSKTTVITCTIQDYQRGPSAEKLTRSTVTLAPDGAPVEA